MAATDAGAVAAVVTVAATVAAFSSAAAALSEKERLLAGFPCSLSLLSDDKETATGGAAVATEPAVTYIYEVMTQ